ncbi:hypothetical protein C1645_858972 [Glomus cerebriforme]|uniref:Uncharacterized protein n=1 Tax=Glomus cerebriforme TaxID=658196 RepID=A0A397SPL4_9GLOM|nr:hypothetical protein C1645_858972 [Glomus cerebriforme]
MVGGDITGLDYDEIFGHVHFESWEKASRFYYSTVEKHFYYDDDKERGPIRFYGATYYNSTRKDTETANTRTSTSVIEISDHNDINENERSKKRIITENLRKSPEFPVSVLYGLYEYNHTFNIVLHIPGIRNKADLLVSSVSDKLFIIEGNFSEKNVPGKSIKNFLPVGPFKAEVELPSGFTQIDQMSLMLEWDKEWELRVLIYRFHKILIFLLRSGISAFSASSSLMRCLNNSSSDDMIYI